MTNTTTAGAATAPAAGPPGKPTRPRKQPHSDESTCFVPKNVQGSWIRNQCRECR